MPMPLIDDVHIKVKAGNGGNGAKSIKQLYGSAKTVADGGNGGRGGNIYFEGTTNLSDLSEFRFKKEIKAQNGRNGMNKDLDGRKGENTIVLVPFGTKIIDEDSQESLEVLKKGERLIVAYGGQGGRGNHDYKIDLEHFKEREDVGEKGEERSLHLILNLIADIGLIGLPNAGKSSLLSSLTNATPKVGSYPFTTLEPNLGVMKGIVLADIPGLISGASKGKGLGMNFLKHIEKTKILLHCLDISDKDILNNYRTVRKELEEYSDKLLNKKEIVLLTKMDLIDEDFLKKQKKIISKYNKYILSVSIYDEKSLERLKKEIPLLLEK
jgi:GTP-binding protein